MSIFYNEIIAPLSVFFVNSSNFYTFVLTYGSCIMAMKKSLYISLILAASTPTWMSMQAQAPSAEQIESQLVDVAAPSVRAIDGVLELYCGHQQNVTFKIFSITGQLVKSVTVASASARIELPKGFYIVKCDKWTRRVMLR